MRLLHSLPLALIVLPGFIAFTGCKKEPKIDPSTLPHIYFNKEALEYVNLKQGSYFIYKDTATGILDSVIVTESSLSERYSAALTLFGVTSPAHYAQRFELTLTKKSGSTSDIWFKGEAGASGSGVMMTTVQLVLYEKDVVAFNFPFCLSCGDGRLFASLTVEGKTYTDVVFVSRSLPSGTYHYYWAKGFGIIKRKLTLTGYVKTYTLVRNG